jgi:hypothetical protein
MEGHELWYPRDLGGRTTKGGWGAGTCRQEGMGGGVSHAEAPRGGVPPDWQGHRGVVPGGRLIMASHGSRYPRGLHGRITQGASPRTGKVTGGSSPGGD